MKNASWLKPVNPKPMSDPKHLRNISREHGPQTPKPHLQGTDTATCPAVTPSTSAHAGFYRLPREASPLIAKAPNPHAVARGG